MIPMVEESNNRGWISWRFEDGIGACGWQRGGARNERVSKPVVFELVDSWCFVMNYSILGEREGEGRVGFSAYSSLMNGVGGGEGWKKLLRSLVNESDVYCAMRARERERKKKYREKNFENIGKKMVGKMVFDRDCERRRKGILTKLSNFFKMRKACFHCSTRLLFLSFSLSLTHGPVFFIDRQRGWKISRANPTKRWSQTPWFLARDTLRKRRGHKQMKPGQKNPHSSEKGFSGAKRVYLTFNFPGDVSFFFFPLFSPFFSPLFSPHLPLSLFRSANCFP